MNNKYWEVRNVNKSDDEKRVVSVALKDTVNNSYTATFKWDGCIDIFKYSNGFTPEDKMSEEEYTDNVDYIHICDIDEMIVRLTELKKIMEEFGVK